MNENDYLDGLDGASSPDSSFSLGGFVKDLASAAASAGQAFRNFQNPPTNAQTAAAQGKSGGISTQMIVIVGGVIVAVIALVLFLRKP